MAARPEAAGRAVAGETILAAWKWRRRQWGLERALCGRESGLMAVAQATPKGGGKRAPRAGRGETEFLLNFSRQKFPNQNYLQKNLRAEIFGK